MNTSNKRWLPGVRNAANQTRHPGPLRGLFFWKRCEECRGTGAKGRVGLHKLQVADDLIRKLIQARACGRRYAQHVCNLCQETTRE